ncbi:MAG: hypothetical protein JKY89_00300 [Immundisolibacteraceae bacterium]|nr:hypothetical protein [Immundisolibacteraceae bacterium]
MGMHHSKVVSESLRNGSPHAGKAMANRKSYLASKAIKTEEPKPKKKWYQFF